MRKIIDKTTLEVGAWTLGWTAEDVCVKDGLLEWFAY